MYELKVITSFSAAHRLRMVGEKCENLHGHNWKIELCVAGERLDEGGVLLDFGELKRCLAGIIDGLDHRFLNELEAFRNVPPSSEQIARHIAHGLHEVLKDRGVRVTRVSAWESENACASYLPEP